MSELPRPPDRPPQVTVSASSPQPDWIPHRGGPPRSGSRAGCATVIVLAVLAAVVVAGIALAIVALRHDDDPVERSVSELEVGDCLVQPGGGTEYRFEVVGCDDPHDDEVIALGRLNPDGTAPYPDLAALRAQIERSCVGSAFEDYVGVPAARSAYHVLYITPDRQAWREAAGSYVCLVDGGGEALHGSARGTAR